MIHIFIFLVNTSWHASYFTLQPLQSIPAEKIMKKPIPDEHLVLKTTFEGLIQKCLAVATDPVSLCNEINSVVQQSEPLDE